MILYKPPVWGVIQQRAAQPLMYNIIRLSLQAHNDDSGDAYPPFDFY